MPKQEGQKSKLLALLHIFEQQTDEDTDREISVIHKRAAFPAGILSQVRP